LGRLTWRPARVADVREETPRAQSLLLSVPDWPGHLPGQHMDVRLTAEDGYQAQRSYSIASAPGAPLLMLTVERLEGGEVSPYLTTEVRPGDTLEVRGPIGGYFVWDAACPGPLLLLAGGSGMVPLMSMLRHRAAGTAAGTAAAPARLLYSCRTGADVLYRAELEALAAADPELRVWYTLTRARAGDPAGFRRRVDAGMLGEVAWPPEDGPLAYVCGGNGFVETVASALAGLGYAPDRIRTERFGPSGAGE